MRDHLNTQASHISFDTEASKHLFNYQKSEVKTTQVQTVDVLKRNISTLNAFQIFIVAEAIRCLDVIGHAPESLIAEYEDWRLRSIKASPPPNKGL